MAEQVRVVDVETAERPPSATPRSGWALFVLGVAVGIGAAIVFVTPTGPSPTATTTSAEIAPPITSEEPQAQAPGVAEVVEGFPDALVAVSRSSGSSLNHLLWPHAGALNVNPMAGGDEVLFDSSGRYVVLASDVPGGAGAVLSLGRHHQIRSVAAGVTGYAWHDSEPGVLAFTAVSEGIWRLSTVASSFEPVVVMESDTERGRIVAWGDWGWAIQSDSEVTLLTTGGELKDTEPGTALASHHTGWLLVHADGPKLVSAGGGVIALETDLAVGRPRAAAFSPNASKLAVAGPRGVSIVYLDTETVETVDIPADAVAWSSDSRFLLAASGAGVIVFDDVMNSIEAVLRQHSVLTVSVVPLTGS